MIPSRFSRQARRDSNTPMSLFLFLLGDGPGDYLGYTDAEHPVTLEGRTYQPAPIKRDKIKTQSRGKTADLKVTVAAASEIAARFRGGAPRRVIGLQIYEGFSEDPDENPAGGVADLIWTGRVLSGTRKKAQTILSCDTARAGMTQPGLTRNYQRECPHVPYGEECGANRAAATRTAVATASFGRTAALPSDWNLPNEPTNFIGGVLEWAGEFGVERRTIVNADAGSLTLDSSVPDLAGLSVSIVLGCPRVMEACRTLHNNILNYGGQAFIPLDNPVNKNNHT